MLGAIRCCYVSNEQEPYVRHQQQCRFPFFLSFSFLLSRLLASFFLYVFCYTFNCTKSKSRENKKSYNSVGDGGDTQVSIITSSSLLYFYRLAIE